MWVTAKGLRAYECRVAIIGEKKETNEIITQMRRFFAQRDAEGAKEYFAQYLKKRPDVIMEASDITGECKLCLQAVSTANLELAEYGHSFLEHMNDYDAVIVYFRQLNKAAAEYVKRAASCCKTSDHERTNTPKAEYVQTIEADGFDRAVIMQASDIALRAAVRLYAADMQTAQEAFEQIKIYQKG